MTAEYRHTPVMREEVLDLLALQNGLIACDCTLGGGGHAFEIAQGIAPDGMLIGIDQDDMALEAAHTRLAHSDLSQPPILLKGNFADLDDLLVSAHVPLIDRFLFDLGVSSPQLDIPERGFSYREEAPLDMRMDPGTRTLTAAEVIADYSETDLARVIREYGEEKWASRIASFIVSRRARFPIETTTQLVDVIKAAIPASARRSGGHPAKRTFQALRIEVNGELASLEEGLTAAIRWLSPGGRIVTMSYHSLEDRIVKRTFADAASGCTCPPDLPVCVCGKKPLVRHITHKALTPTQTEVSRNPRARSVKVRAIEKLPD